MERLKLSININAPTHAAWALLADYSHPHKYVKGIVDAHLKTDHATGIGAVRHCDLPSMMGMRQYIVEEITEWVEGEKLAYRVTDTAAPIKDGYATWTVSGDEHTSTITFEVAYRPKGLMGRIMKGMLKKEFTRQLTTGLGDMKAFLEAQSRFAAA